MARISPFSLVCRSCFFWFLLFSLVLLPFTACGALVSRATPPSDPACGESATSPNNVDQRYLSSITMQNETTGWGQNYTQKGGVPSGVPTAEQTLLHTTDGGCHWQIVKSWKYSMEPSPDFYPFFLSASLALVYVNGVFFLTRDAGASWSSVTLPVAAGQKAFPGQIFFLTSHLGWMTAAFSHEGVLQFSDLLRSTDGGMSWTRLHIALPMSLTNQSRITSLSMRSETSGWITGSSHDSDGREHSWIFLTHDGGRSWHEQRLPSPQGYASSRLLVLGQPRFFSARDGVLPASTTLTPPVGISIFITHDGGESWQSQPFFPINDVAFNPEVSGGPRIPTFTDLSTGWSSVLTGAGNDTADSLSLLRTTDRGRSWQPFNQQLPVRPSDPGFQFITDRVAFALAYTGDPINFQSPSELYRTTNGGKTWTTLRYTIRESQ